MRNRRWMTIGYKLLISYLLFAITPVTVVGYFAYTSSVQSIREQANTNVKGTLRQMRDNISYKMEDIQRLSNRLYFDTTLQDQLRRYEFGWEGHEAITRYVLPQMANTVHASRTDIRLAVYFENDAIPEVFDLQDEHIDPLSRGAGFELFHMDRLYALDWYRELKLPPEDYRGDSVLWRQVDSDQRFGNISLFSRMVDTHDPFDIRKIGMIRIVTRLNNLFEAVDYNKIGERSELFVLNQNQAPVYSSREKHTGSPRLTDWHPHDHLEIHEEIPGLDWTLVAFIPNELLENNARRVRSLTVFVCLVSLLVVALLSAVVSRLFSVKVKKVTSVLSAFCDGDFQKRMDDAGRDEFAQIALALNEVGENTGRLIEEVYLTNIQKKEAELSALQAQINPHFLYNTLYSISRLAKIGEIDKLDDMVTGLAQFYRLTLNEGKTIITIDKEMQHAQVYIQIQKIKYIDRIRVLYDIDPAIRPLHTVNLILQPFIENILEHALYGDTINIKVQAYREGERVVFKIIDDGIGMRPETLDQIMNASDGTLGYGIFNVNRRIKLQFGDDYGAVIFSRLGMGTAVRITIPAYDEGKKPEEG